MASVSALYGIMRGQKTKMLKKKSFCFNIFEGKLSLERRWKDLVGVGPAEGAVPLKLASRV